MSEQYVDKARVELLGNPRSVWRFHVDAVEPEITTGPGRHVIISSNPPGFEIQGDVTAIFTWAAELGVTALNVIMTEGLPIPGN